jgi:uncharacterized protein YggE
MEHEVVVRGEGEVRVMPDQATVRVLVDGDGSKRDEAYAEAARVATAVDTVLQAEAEAGALARVMTTALVVQPRTRWQNGEAIRTGWRASRTSVVEVRALERLGDLLAQLTASGGAVSDLTWGLDAANVAYDEARGRAGQDARRRAERYAAALGIKLGGIAWVAEPGLRTGGDHLSPRLALAAAAPRAMAGGPDQAIEVAPEEITLTATVEVGFAIASN